MELLTPLHIAHRPMPGESYIVTNWSRASPPWIGIICCTDMLDDAMLNISMPAGADVRDLSRPDHDPCAGIPHRRRQWAVFLPFLCVWRWVKKDQLFRLDLDSHEILDLGLDFSGWDAKQRDELSTLLALVKGLPTGSGVRVEFWKQHIVDVADEIPIVDQRSGHRRRSTGNVRDSGSAAKKDTTQRLRLNPLFDEEEDKREHREESLRREERQRRAAVHRRKRRRSHLSSYDEDDHDERRDVSSSHERDYSASDNDDGDDGISTSSTIYNQQNQSNIELAELVNEEATLNEARAAVEKRREEFERRQRAFEVGRKAKRCRSELLQKSTSGVEHGKQSKRQMMGDFMMRPLPLSMLPSSIRTAAEYLNGNAWEDERNAGGLCNADVGGDSIMQIPRTPCPTRSPSSVQGCTVPSDDVDRTDVIEIYVGPTNRLFRVHVDKFEKNASDVLKAHVVSSSGPEGKTGTRGYVMSPTFRDIDPNVFSLMVEYLEGSNLPRMFGAVDTSEVEEGYPGPERERHETSNMPILTPRSSFEASKANVEAYGPKMVRLQYSSATFPSSFSKEQVLKVMKLYILAGRFGMKQMLQSIIFRTARAFEKGGHSASGVLDSVRIVFALSSSSHQDSRRDIAMANRSPLSSQLPDARSGTPINNNVDDMKILLVTLLAYNLETLWMRLPGEMSNLFGGDASSLELEKMVYRRKVEVIAEEMQASMDEGRSNGYGLMKEEGIGDFASAQ